MSQAKTLFLLVGHADEDEVTTRETFVGTTVHGSLAEAKAAVKAELMDLGVWDGELYWTERDGVHEASHELVGYYMIREAEFGVRRLGRG